jgi:hypothetical protein
MIKKNKKISRRNKKISRRNKTKQFGGGHYNKYGSWVDNKKFTISGGNYIIDVEENESS